MDKNPFTANKNIFRTANVQEIYGPGSAAELFCFSPKQYQEGLKSRSSTITRLQRVQSRN